MKYKNPYSVLVVIYAQNTGRVLMLQRQDDLNFWQSVTGTIEEGEQPLRTAMREVKEETGIDIKEQNLILVDCQYSVKFEIFPQFRYKYAPDTTHNTEHWFLLALPDEVEPQLSEHLAFQWLDAKEALRRVQRNNRIRKEYYKYYTGEEWDDMTHYDLPLNTSKITLEQGVDLILEYLRIRGKL